MSPFTQMECEATHITPQPTLNALNACGGCGHVGSSVHDLYAKFWQHLAVQDLQRVTDEQWNANMVMHVVTYKCCSIKAITVV